jgi:hypothetical protein
MTQLLEKALTEVYKLPPEKQDAIAAVILEELEDEQRWDAAFAASQDQPVNETLEKIKQDKILLEIEIIETDKLEEGLPSKEVKGYAILDELVGFCASNRTDTSINHDTIIYELMLKK